jgi:uncharacterized protein
MVRTSEPPHYDATKREKTLTERGLDFADAGKLFDGPTLTLLDDRRDYGESRFQTYGLVGQRLLMVVWTRVVRIATSFPMRKCNAREKARFQARLA